MSGTSLDGVDAVVADFTSTEGRACDLLGAAHVPFGPALRDELMALQHPCADEIARAARAANALADLYAESIVQAVAKAGVAAADVVAAGVHGQTLRHRPDEGWTLQLNNAARVAERAGVTVVADFRARDVAAGGQGAPLVPAFHAAAFAKPGVHRVIVNIGGIANLTDLPPDGLVRGFDTGPGNVLLDLWHAPPKTTGRDLFNAFWLDSRLGRRTAVADDVQATLAALTAGTIADAVRRHCAGASEILVCGGGANNATLMALLAAELAPRAVSTTAEHGVAVEHVEALAFAWLAREAINGRPGNIPAVTGARGLRVLGAIHAGHVRTALA